jgi:hypothetical protein
MNIKRAKKELERLREEYIDAINHDEDLMLVTFFGMMEKILEALDEPEEKESQLQKIINMQQAAYKDKPDPIREVYEKYKDKPRFKDIENQRELISTFGFEAWLAIKQHCST